MSDPMVHPDHDALVAVVESWYRDSTPEMGYHVEPLELGFFMRHAGVPGLAQVTIRELPPGRIPALLQDVRAFYGIRPVTILVEDRGRDREIGPALVAAGCRRGAAEVHLAHVGTIRDRLNFPEVALERATPSTLRRYVRTRWMAFASSEAEPPQAGIEEEIAQRRAELGSGGCFWIAKIRGEPVSVIGCYEGPDRFIFQLGTRVPFRRRGIATWLLCRALREGLERGCRSVIINGEEEDAPVRMYRRLGFTDVLYWRRRYAYGGEPGSPTEDAAARPAPV